MSTTPFLAWRSLRCSDKQDRRHEQASGGTGRLRFGLTHLKQKGTTHFWHAAGTKELPIPLSSRTTREKHYASVSLALTYRRGCGAPMFRGHHRSDRHSHSYQGPERTGQNNRPRQELPDRISDSWHSNKDSIGCGVRGATIRLTAEPFALG